MSMHCELVKTVGEGTVYDAHAVGVLSCDRVFPSNKGRRPLLLSVVADAGAARAVAASVRIKGELAVPGGSRHGGSSHSSPNSYELLKSLGYEATAQHVLGGTATILQWHLPGFFELDPGTRSSDDVSAESPPFIVMPPRASVGRERALSGDAVDEVVEWVLRDTAALSGRIDRVAGDPSWNGGSEGESRFDASHPASVAARSPRGAWHIERAANNRAALREAVVWAPLIAAFVDRRIDAPTLRDLRYQTLLVCALIESGAACWPSGPLGDANAWGSAGYAWSIRALGLDALGWASPFLCATRGPGVLQQLAVECVAGYEAAVAGGSGTVGRSGDARAAYAAAVTASRTAYLEREQARKAAAAKAKKG